jgi:hypothetical protein
MALVKVYDLDGIEHEKESVDARECCREMGWSLTPPLPKSRPIPEPKPEPQPKKGRK